MTKVIESIVNSVFRVTCEQCRCTFRYQYMDTYIDCYRYVDCPMCKYRTKHEFKKTQLTPEEMADLRPAEVAEEKHSSFIEHLEEAAKLVDSWPEWKRNVFGSLTPPASKIERDACNLFDALCEIKKQEIYDYAMQRSKEHSEAAQHCCAKAIKNGEE